MSKEIKLIEMSVFTQSKMKRNLFLLRANGKLLIHVFEAHRNSACLQCYTISTHKTSTSLVTLFKISQHLVDFS